MSFSLRVLFFTDNTVCWMLSRACISCLHQGGFARDRHHETVTWASKGCLEALGHRSGSSELW